MSDNAILERVTRMVAPLVAQMQLELYDIEFRGGTLRITIDTPPGSETGVALDTIALVTRMISRDFDHDDPMPGHYNLEVTSPGLERTLRTPAHFQREVGKTVALRLRDSANSERRLQGTLIAATDADVTLRLDDEAASERVIAHSQIDRARTVFVWGPAPKPGKKPAGSKPAASKSSGSKKTAAHAATSSPTEASTTQEAR
jgi:ribosome maturation factor RimP